jgi:hypothetical protein
MFPHLLERKTYFEEKGTYKDIVGGSGIHPQEMFIFLSLWSLIFVFLDTTFDIFYPLYKGLVMRI